LTYLKIAVFNGLALHLGGWGWRSFRTGFVQKFTSCMLLIADGDGISYHDNHSAVLRSNVHSIKAHNYSTAALGPPDLNRRLIWNGCHRLRRMCPLRINRPLCPRHCWLSLQMHVYPIGLGLSHLCCILFYPVEEFFSASGQADMLDAHVNALFNVAVANALVDDDADGGFGDVVNYAGFTVVDFVGHAVEMSDL